jgi:hypothetical protein
LNRYRLRNTFHTERSPTFKSRQRQFNIVSYQGDFNIISQRITRNVKTGRGHGERQPSDQPGHPISGTPRREGNRSSVRQSHRKHHSRDSLKAIFEKARVIVSHYQEPVEMGDFTAARSQCATRQGYATPEHAENRSSGI